MENSKVIIPMILLLLIAAEIIWSWRGDKKAYNIKDTLANISIFFGFQVSKFLFAGYQVALMTWAGNYVLFILSRNAVSFIACFILADFSYYWFHRLSHKWRPLWAFHLIHHSSRYMNLSTAYRLNWFSVLVSPLFFLPLAFIGFPADFIALSYAINLLYQFLMHTEGIGKLGKLEGIVDTPSAHRVHHGSNRLYIDKNFGGVFMIWDRIFKTYQPEAEKPVYGITSGFISNNPFVLVFKGFLDFIAGKMRYKG